MTTTVFQDYTTPIVASWLNDVNASTYQGLFGPTISYVDTGVVGSFTSTTAGYNQLVVQNKSNATNASANFNVSNNAATASTNFVEMGINSSTFTGTGSFSQAGNAYVASASTDLVIGTYGPKAVRFVVNSGATDAMVIDTSGNVGIGITPISKFDVLVGDGSSSSTFRAATGQIRTRAYVNATIGGDIAGLIANGSAYGPMLISALPLYLGANGAIAATIDSNQNMLLTAGTGGLGYGTGAGGTVTQITSRTTTVTINKPTGAITLFTAAGTTAWTTFAVSNSLVGPNDVVVVSTKGGTNTYLANVTFVGASQFNISFATTSGVASDAPTINFAILKGSVS